MKIIVYVVAPLIHYAPIYAGLAELKREKGFVVRFHDCNTDLKVIERACGYYTSRRTRQQDTLILALTSTTDLARSPAYNKAAKKAAEDLRVLTILMPRVPLWYVRGRNRSATITRVFNGMLTPKFRPPRIPLKIACYNADTTSYWVVSQSFPKGTIEFDTQPLSFSNDRVSSEEFRRRRIDLAATLHPWRYDYKGRRPTGVSGPPVAPFGFTAVLFHKIAFEKQNLRSALQDILFAIDKVTVELYSSFELPGFDWRRYSASLPIRVLTKHEYVDRLVDAFTQLRIPWRRYFTRPELQSGIEYLSREGAWALPESALRSIAGVSEKLESFRTMSDRLADQYRITEEERRRLVDNLEYIKENAFDISETARIAAMPLSDVSNREKLLELIHYIDQQLLRLNIPARTLRSLPPALREAIESTTQSQRSESRVVSDSLRHLFQQGSHIHRLRDAIVRRVNDLVAKTLRELQHGGVFIGHIDHLTPFFNARRYSEHVWWPLLHDPEVPDFWKAYLAEKMRVPKVTVSFTGHGPAFMPFVAYVVQGLFSYQRRPKPDRKPPTQMSINVASTETAIEVTAQWGRAEKSEEWMFRDDPKLSREVDKLHGRVWFVSQLFWLVTAHISSAPNKPFKATCVFYYRRRTK